MPRLTITGAARRRAETLSIRCALRGDLSELVIPAPLPRPQRKGRLWETTCLEFFLAAERSRRYWEFNLSPSGSWNVYRFSSYRSGMREEPAFASLPFRVRTGPAALRLSLDLDLGEILPSVGPLDVSVAAVLKTLRGATSHWALAHPGPRPDFHRRDAFVLRLPPG